MHQDCDASCARTSSTTTDLARTWHSTRTRRSPARSSRPHSAGSWKCLRLVDSTIVTNDARPDLSVDLGAFINRERRWSAYDRRDESPGPSSDHARTRCPAVDVVPYLTDSRLDRVFGRDRQSTRGHPCDTSRKFFATLSGYDGPMRSNLQDGSSESRSMHPSSWLFIRGPESICIIRASSGALIMSGPGHSQARRTFQDEPAMQAYQVDVAERLSAAGWLLLGEDHDRRRGIERRTMPRATPDQRRGTARES